MFKKTIRYYIYNWKGWNRTDISIITISYDSHWNRWNKPVNIKLWMLYGRKGKKNWVS